MLCCLPARQWCIFFRCQGHRWCNKPPLGLRFHRRRRRRRALQPAANEDLLLVTVRETLSFCLQQEWLLLQVTHGWVEIRSAWAKILGWVRMWVPCASIQCSVCRLFWPISFHSYYHCIFSVHFELQCISHLLDTALLNDRSLVIRFQLNTVDGWNCIPFMALALQHDRLIRRFILFFFCAWAECLFELPFILLGLTISTLWSFQHCRIVSIYGKWIINTNNEGVRQANSEVWLSRKGIRNHYLLTL